METLLAILPSATTLIVLLAGTYLLRSLSRPFILYTKTFNLTPPPPPPTDKTPISISRESPFPPNWLTSPSIFDLERRAIFSKTWLLVAHRTRFTRPGDYQSFNIAGFPIFLILGKDNRIRAFHNVCRHRAYTVTRREQGSAPVLGCRYHGWTYNAYGELIKAPHFEGMRGFEFNKKSNGLFRVKTFTSSAGFVYVNLEEGEEDKEDNVDDRFAERNNIDANINVGGAGKDGGRWVGGGIVAGEFNWKMGLTEANVFGRLDKVLPPRRGIPLVRDLVDFLRKTPETVSLFPIASLHVLRCGDCWVLLNIFPVSERKTSVRYDLYCSASSKCDGAEQSSAIENCLQGIVGEIEGQYKLYTDSATGDTWNHALDTPENESESKNTQKRILDQLEAHIKLEKTLGTEKYPAQRRPRENKRFQEADQLCKSLDCLDGSKKEGLSW